MLVSPTPFESDPLLMSTAAVVFAYDYHPKSKTLYEEHLGTGPGPGQPFAGISERILWSYVAQISNGLKAIHTAGLACRTVEPTKILLTGRNR
jgi:PAB-dependent poly(A)-specific ribonuclease subunit 3